MAHASRRISSNPYSGSHFDETGAGHQLNRDRATAHCVELSTVGHLDVGSNTQQQTETSRTRCEKTIDVELLAQVLEPVLGPDSDFEARNLIATFGSIAAIFSHFAIQTCTERATNVDVARRLNAVSLLMSSSLRRTALSAPLSANSSALHNYLFNKMAHSRIELCHVLFLNASNRIIEEKVMATGTVDKVNIYVREIVRAALERDATAIILVHNHPSGDQRPSKADITITEKLIEACTIFDLNMLDHLIVAQGGVASLRDFERSASACSSANSKKHPAPRKRTVATSSFSKFLSNLASELMRF